MSGRRSSSRRSTGQSAAQTAAAAKKGWYTCKEIILHFKNESVVYTGLPFSQKIATHCGRVTKTHDAEAKYKETRFSEKKKAH